MSRYLVKDKFTYERVPQTDYSYNPDYLPYSWIDGRVQSHNVMLPLYQAETLLALGDLTVAGDTPANMALTGAVQEVLSRSSALRVRPTESGIVYRATFFGAAGESFSSVGTSCAGHPDFFALSRMDFTPVRFRLETDGAPLTASLSLEAVWNTLGEWGGQAHFYTPENAVLTDRGCAMALTVDGRGGFASRSLPLDPGGCYSMLMPRRNTVFVILSNPDGLASATLSFTSEAAPDYLPENAVTLPLPQDADMHALYFNLSACPGCSGRLTGFRLEIEGRGTLLLHGYSFEQEKPLETPRATVTSCLADATATTLTVTGRLCRRRMRTDSCACTPVPWRTPTGWAHRTRRPPEKSGSGPSRCPLCPLTGGSAWQICRSGWVRPPCFPISSCCSPRRRDSRHCACPTASMSKTMRCPTATPTPSIYPTTPCA